MKTIQKLLICFLENQEKIPLDTTLRFLKHLQFNCLLENGYLVYSSSSVSLYLSNFKKNS